MGKFLWTVVKLRMNDFWKKRLGSDDDYKREELIKKIVDVIEHMSIEELEALAYGMSTKTAASEL